MASGPTGAPADGEEASYAAGGLVRSYRDLLVWQKGIDLVKAVYDLTKLYPHSEIFGLTAQTRRAAVSVPSNIAEGQARGHTAEFRQFPHVALGSLAELDTQLAIASRLGFVSEKPKADVEQHVGEVRRMIHGLLAKLPAGRRAT